MKLTNLKYKRLTLLTVVALVVVTLSVSLWGCGFFGLLGGYGEADLIALMNELATSMFAGDGLSVNILLENSDKFGLADQPAHLPIPEFDKSKYEESMAGLSEIAQVFEQINYDKLSVVGKRDYDTVINYFTTYSAYKDFYYLDNRDYIGANDGWNVLLPLYLDKLAFKTENDVQNWITLASEAGTAFPEYARFEEEVLIANGYGRAATTYRKIAEQCAQMAAVEEGKEHFLIDLFVEKINAVDFLNSEAVASYVSQAREAVNNSTIPAYVALGEKASEFASLGLNLKPLVEYQNGNYAEGRLYYELLFKDNASTDDSVEEAYQNMSSNLSEVLEKMETLSNQLEGEVTLSANFSTEAINRYWSTLKTRYVEDFPALPSSVPDATFFAVPDAMSEFYNPASYFKSAVDSTSAPETIYINEKNAGGYLGFDIISHEGLPGHMLQHAYYKSTGANMLRALLGYTGYAEGWASYAQFYASKYFEGTPEEKIAYEIICLEDVASTYIVTMIDIAVNYKGRSYEDLEEDQFFGKYINQNIYEYVVENPAVHASYGYGYYKMYQLKCGYQGSDLDFHKAILSMGPTTFEIIEKYL